MYPIQVNLQSEHNSVFPSFFCLNKFCPALNQFPDIKIPLRWLISSSGNVLNSSFRKSTDLIENESSWTCRLILPTFHKDQFLVHCWC